jgi:hypothetical protein
MSNLKQTYTILDWDGNLKFNGKEFESSDEAWDYIYANVDNSLFEETEDENDNEFAGFYVQENN